MDFRIDLAKSLHLARGNLQDATEVYLTPQNSRQIPQG